MDLRSLVTLVPGLPFFGKTLQFLSHRRSMNHLSLFPSLLIHQSARFILKRMRSTSLSPQWLDNSSSREFNVNALDPLPFSTQMMLPLFILRHLLITFLRSPLLILSQHILPIATICSCDHLSLCCSFFSISHHAPDSSGRNFILCSFSSSFSSISLLSF